MSGEDRPGRRRDLWDDDDRSSSQDHAPASPAPERSTASDRPAAADRPAASARPGDGGNRPEVTSRRNLHHAKRSRRFPWWIVLLALLLVAGLCLGGAWAFLGGEDEAECGGDPIQVAATPEIAEPLKEALSKVNQDCTSFEVSAVGSATAVQNINEGTAPDVWVPDSSSWIDAIKEDNAPGQWLEGQSIASSPILLAAGSEVDGAPTKAQSWTSIINEESELLMSNPDVDTASRLAFHASRVDQPRIGLTTGKRMIFLSRFAAPSVNKVFDDYERDPKKKDSAVFPASEQDIFTFNTDHKDTPPLRGIAPAVGTLSLDYPWITNPELQGDVLKATDAARTELGSLKVRESLTAAGFRDAQGQGGPELAGQKAPEITELEAPSRSERLGLVEQWDIMRTDMRMLALIDVSGSMKWASTTPGKTRWDVTRASLLQGASLLPDGSKVGSWIFSSADDLGKRDYKSIAPIKQLDRGKGSHREHMTKLFEQADKYVRNGDTALYDSVWAAHQEMVKNYDPEYVNSVVVMTDGENDDPNGGLSLNQLLDKLNKAYDPQRPVRVIAIGMGEADPTALRKIADETGGTSYIAETPEDIERVLVEALLARSGR